MYAWRSVTSITGLPAHFQMAVPALQWHAASSPDNRCGYICLPQTITFTRLRERRQRSVTRNGGLQSR